MVNSVPHEFVSWNKYTSNTTISQLLDAKESLEEIGRSHFQIHTQPHSLLLTFNFWHNFWWYGFMGTGELLREKNAQSLRLAPCINHGSNTVHLLYETNSGLWGQNFKKTNTNNGLIFVKCGKISFFARLVEILVVAAILKESFNENITNTLSPVTIRLFSVPLSISCLHKAGQANCN